MVHAPGDAVRGYHIVRTLGRGGLGTTFEATRDATGESVALKRLKVSDADAWKRVELFEREAQVLARLSLRAIPRYIDHFTVDGADGPVLYIAQELVVGRSLGDIVQASDTPMTEQEVRRIADELLAVLDYLGAQAPPVVHRDLKPENVLVRDDGSIVLVDFGAARATAAPADGGSTTVGTYGYMAPEQLQGIATPATDIYGLGCTLLFLLTGRNPTDLPRQRLRIDFRSQVRVTEPFAVWLDKALEPAVEDRFTSAGAARAALHADPPSAVAAVPATHRRLLVLIAAVSAAAIVGGAFLAKRAPAQPAAPVQAAAPLQAAAPVQAAPPAQPAPLPSVGPTCAELTGLDPKLAALSDSDLEARFRASAMLPPSMEEKQLASIRASMSMYTPERRACMTRLSLVSAVVNQERMRETQPTTWGLGHTPEELRRIYLSQPLRAEHTEEQRKDVLDQVEQLFVANLHAEGEGDREFWRRQYLGLAVVCEASDEGLAKIHATRPPEGDCVHITPRTGVVP